jgi:hypothetical protein
MNSYEYIQQISNNKVGSDLQQSILLNIIDNIREFTNINQIIYRLKKQEFGSLGFVKHWRENSDELVSDYIMRNIILNKDLNGIKFKKRYTKKALLESIERLFSEVEVDEKDREEIKLSWGQSKFY